MSAIFQSFAEQTVKGIQENIRTKRVTKFGAMNASGQAADSIKYRLTDNGFEIYVSGKAVAYFDALETGRKPGKHPRPEDLRPWVLLKDLPRKWGVSEKSAIFLVGRSIAKRGTTVFQQGGKTGIISDWINEKRIQELRELVLPVFAEEVSSLILGEFKSDIR